MCSKRISTLLLALMLCASLAIIACDRDGDDDDDQADDDSNDDDATGDDDSGGDDDIVDDDDDLFPPDEQQPLYEKGQILEPDSLECFNFETGEYQLNCNHHGSTIAQLPEGSMAVVWYHGVAEKSPDARIVWSRLAPGEREWPWPEVLYDEPLRSEGNPALWVHEDGTLYVFFVTIFGEGWPQSYLRLIRSFDNGATWDNPLELRERYCWMARHRPVRLGNGELLLPLYNECLAYPVFIRSTDDFATWTEEAHLNFEYYRQHPGQIQPACIVLEGDVITALTRDGMPSNRIKRMISLDGGLNWGPSIPLDLPNSGTSIDQVRLLDGSVVVVFNNSQERRFPLSVALSHDGGETFDAIRNIDDECEGEGCSYAYPSIAQNTLDGTIWVSYSVGRSTIGWVQFNERWLMDGDEQPNIPSK
ncbi:MAG: exo-alpha-sialidase [Candidatus Alcyoniella australis]|nr:exo-alpha-sialidase [Candidatus Alcyoniella australis]